MYTINIEDRFIIYSLYTPHHFLKIDKFPYSLKPVVKNRSSYIIITFIGFRYTCTFSCGNRGLPGLRDEKQNEKST